MTKPHEQEWTTHHIALSESPGVCTREGYPVAEVVVRYVPRGRDSVRDIQTAEAEARFIAGAPSMARALLEVRRCPHREAPCDTCMGVVDTALREAGVLP